MTVLKDRIRLAFAAFALVVASPASANLISFDYQSNDHLDRLVFQIDEVTLPGRPLSTSSYNDKLFEVGTVPARIAFYTALQSGGFAYRGLDQDLKLRTFGAFGPQLFVGLTSFPTFLNGFFLVTTGASPNSPISGTLTISGASATAPVPEPGAWTLMLVGFIGCGMGVRRSNRAHHRLIAPLRRVSKASGAVLATLWFSDVVKRSSDANVRNGTQPSMKGPVGRDGIASLWGGTSQEHAQIALHRCARGMLWQQSAGRRRTTPSPGRK